MRQALDVHFRIFLLSLLTIMWAVSDAQTLFNKSAKITVASNTLVAIAGDVSNQGTIVNNGHMKVAGHWLNSGVYMAGVGQVTFHGASATMPQMVQHGGQTFSRLTISGGTKKIILSDLVIEKAIGFENGIMETSGDARVIFDRHVVIGGASDSSHIHGPVYNRGSGPKLFPIGNGSSYLPVELTSVSDESAEIGVRAFEFSNLSLSKSSSLASISDSRYWHIDVQTGEFPDSRIVLPMRDESWLSDPGRIVVVESGAADENFRSIGRSFMEGANGRGRITSDFSIAKPFVSLAARGDSELTIYNAVSANGDGLNDFMRIENIENYPGNKLTIFSRWGDKVFEIENYDNDANVFRGHSNVNGNSELTSGNYFYVLEIPGRESQRGFVVVKK